jgi:hypothetical protein
MAVCVHDGIEYGAVGADAERELARAMVRAGLPDGEVVRGVQLAPCGLLKPSPAASAFRRRRKIAAQTLARCLEMAGFVVMKKPPRKPPSTHGGG